MIGSVAGLTMDRTAGSIDGEPLGAAAFRAVLRHVPAAVAVVAAGGPGARAGLTVTAVCALSDQPPTMLVCINRSSSAHDGIIAAGRFSINLLATGHTDIAERFAGRTGLAGDARFDDAAWAVLRTGAPVLRGALAGLDCELVEAQPVATHTVLIGQVVAATVDPAAPPLLYRDGRYLALPAGL